MPRIPLLTDKDALPADQQAEGQAIIDTLHSIRGPFAILLRSPGLAQKVMEAGAHVRLQSSLTMAERETVILTLAREKNATYEWAAHVGVARKNGVRDEAIEVMRHGADPKGLQDDEHDIITFVRQLARENRVAKDVFDALLGRHDERWVVEITATVGQYCYIMAINGAFEVQAAPDTPDKLPV
ncbi:MAG: carboxymuconolactone decarboxylase family protein [Chloroflexota bacterium]